MAHRTALKAALVGALMVVAHPASAADLDLDDGYDVGGDTRVIVKVHNRGLAGIATGSMAIGFAIVAVFPTPRITTTMMIGMILMITVATATVGVPA